MRSQKSGVGGGFPFTKMGLEVNMHSNYISVHFNYEATQGGEEEKERRVDGNMELDITAFEFNIKNKDTMRREECHGGVGEQMSGKKTAAIQRGGYTPDKSPILINYF